MTASELARRLITLIFADRNRMDMIRRELPRTKGASWVRRPHYIVFVEGFSFSWAFDCHRRCCPVDFTMLGCFGMFVRRFGVHGDRSHASE